LHKQIYKFCEKWNLNSGGLEQLRRGEEEATLKKLIILLFISVINKHFKSFVGEKMS